MVWKQVPWAPPVDVPIGAATHLLAWQKNEADGTW